MSNTSFVITSFIAVSLLIVAALSVSGGDFSCAEGAVMVNYGDTAWALLGEHCDGNRSAALNAANWPTVLQPGMVLQLP